MRIIGFAKEWPKLQQLSYTTFRFERRDKDWAIGEIVQVKVKPRSKGGGIFKGIAMVIGKVNKDGGKFITNDEAQADGFEDNIDMWRWMLKSHTPEQLVRPLNKLTLQWIKKDSNRGRVT